MRLSKRGEYGLRAMILLAKTTPEGALPILQINDIANLENIPVKFLETILLTLKNNGFLQSKRGANGGYYLAKSPEEIMLSAIIRCLDGPLAPVRCVSQMAYEPCGCPDEKSCGLRLVMGDVRNAIANILDHTSLADVNKRSQAVKRTV